MSGLLDFFMILAFISAVLQPMSHGNLLAQFPLFISSSPYCTVSVYILFLKVFFPLLNVPLTIGLCFFWKFLAQREDISEAMPAASFPSLDFEAKSVSSDLSLKEYDIDVNDAVSDEVELAVEVAQEPQNICQPQTDLLAKTCQESYPLYDTSSAKLPPEYTAPTFDVAPVGVFSAFQFPQPALLLDNSTFAQVNGDNQALAVNTTSSPDICTAQTLISAQSEGNLASAQASNEGDASIVSALSLPNIRAPQLPTSAQDTDRPRMSDKEAVQSVVQFLIQNPSASLSPSGDSQLDHANPAIENYLQTEEGREVNDYLRRNSMSTFNRIVTSFNNRNNRSGVNATIAAQLLGNKSQEQISPSEDLDQVSSAGTTQHRTATLTNETATQLSNTTASDDTLLNTPATKVKESPSTSSFKLSNGFAEPSVGDAPPFIVSSTPLRRPFPTSATFTFGQAFSTPTRLGLPTSISTNALGSPMILKGLDVAISSPTPPPTNERQDCDTPSSLIQDVPATQGNSVTVSDITQANGPVRVLLTGKGIGGRVVKSVLKGNAALRALEWGNNRRELATSERPSCIPGFYPVHPRPNFTPPAFNAINTIPFPTSLDTAPHTVSEHELAHSHSAARVLPTGRVLRHTGCAIWELRDFARAQARERQRVAHTPSVHPIELPNRHRLPSISKAERLEALRYVHPKRPRPMPTQSKAGSAFKRFASKAISKLKMLK